MLPAPLGVKQAARCSQQHMQQGGEGVQRRRRPGRPRTPGRPCTCYAGTGSSIRPHLLLPLVFHGAGLGSRPLVSVARPDAKIPGLALTNTRDYAKQLDEELVKEAQVKGGGGWLFQLGWGPKEEHSSMHEDEEAQA